MNVKRAILSSLAIAMSAWGAPACNSSTYEGPCSGLDTGGVAAPQAASQGVPLCGSSTSGPASVCLDICGPRPFFFGDAGVPCCLSQDEPGIVVCPVDCTGRRPAGVAARLAARGGAGEHFARMAWLEGAAIGAFRALEDDLRRFRAPKRLVKAAQRAKRDERRHYHATRALARRFGGRDPGIADVPRGTPRPLVEVALENAREGCARETFGALLACWQARAARDRGVAAVLRRIAREETRHAELSWAVHGWMMSRLDAEGRARVRAALAEEMAALARAAPPGDTRGVAEIAGLPDHDETARLVRAFTEVMARS